MGALATGSVILVQVSLFRFVAIQTAAGSRACRLRSWRLVVVPDHKQSVFRPARHPAHGRGFSKWLAAQDQFLPSGKTFHRASKFDCSGRSRGFARVRHSIKLLTQLSACSNREFNFPNFSQFQSFTRHILRGELEADVRRTDVMELLGHDMVREFGLVAFAA